MDLSDESGHKHLIMHCLVFWFLLPQFPNIPWGLSQCQLQWEIMSRNNLVIAHPRRHFWRYLPSEWISVTERCPEPTDKWRKVFPSHKDQLQNTSSSQIPSHKLPVTPTISLPQNSVSWMETGICFLLLVFVVEYGKFINKILCRHNKLIASNVIILSCTADYFSTGKSFCITTNPQGTQFKRYPMITDL